MLNTSKSDFSSTAAAPILLLQPLLVGDTPNVSSIASTTSFNSNTDMKLSSLQ